MTVTIPAPDGIDAAGRSAVLWVPAIADTDAPTVAELEAGIHLSCVIGGFEVTVDVPTTSRRRYCEKQATQRKGTVTYTVPPLVVLDDPQRTATSGYEHLDDLVEGAKGHLVERRGIDFDDAVAASQIVSIYPAEIAATRDVPVDLTNDDGQKFEQEIHVLVTGEVKRHVAVVA